MSNQTRISETYDALEGLLKPKLPGVAVQALTAADFDAESGRIIAKPPAVLLAFRGQRLEQGQDHIGLTYESAMNFMAVCGAENLRSLDAERIGALSLLETVCDVLAGARLTLPAMSQRPIVVLGDVQLAQLELDGTWYALTFAVQSVTQFSGAAAA